MNLGFIIIFGIIILILFSLIEAFGQYEYEPFAYKLAITIRRKMLKTKVGSFDKWNKNLYKKYGYDYMFITDNSCLIRLSGKLEFTLPMVIFPKPIYEIILKNNRLIIKLKIPLLYLFILGTAIYITINKIFIENKFYFTGNIGGILLVLVILYFIIVANKRLNEVALGFIKIIKENEIKN